MTDENQNETAVETPIETVAKVETKTKPNESDMTTVAQEAATAVLEKLDIKSPAKQKEYEKIVKMVSEDIACNVDKKIDAFKVEQDKHFKEMIASEGLEEVDDADIPQPVLEALNAETLGLSEYQTKKLRAVLAEAKEKKPQFAAVNNNAASSKAAGATPGSLFAGTDGTFNPKNVAANVAAIFNRQDGK